MFAARVDRSSLRQGQARTPSPTRFTTRGNVSGEPEEVREEHLQQAQHAGEHRGSAPAGVPASSAPSLPAAALLSLAKRRLLQTKLRIGAVDDPLEHDADRVADQVMRMKLNEAPSSGPVRVQRTCAHCEEEAKRTSAATHVHRKCAACEKEEKEAEGGAGLQRKCAHCEEESALREKSASTAETSSVHAEAPPLVDQVLRSPGKPLAAGDLAFFTPRFGFDFSRVRVHNDSPAAASAQAVNALAYAVGTNIAFAEGQYQPGTVGGRRLIAHELAHVVQQGSVSPSRANSAGIPAAHDIVQRQTPDAGVSSPAGGSADAHTDSAGQQDATGGSGGVGGASGPLCGPDITGAMTSMLSSVEPWFRGLTSFQQSRSCAAVGPGAPVVLVNPIMAWDTRELFLPNTGWLDTYHARASCGSPRDPGCPTDPTRHQCETAGTCGNSVVMGGKCMLAGTANYALFGKICRLCHDYKQRWNRWDMRAIIAAYKTIDWDDSTPPQEVASAAYDGTFPTLPAAAENRPACAGRCGQTQSGSFDFIWEPYRPR